MTGGRYGRTPYAVWDQDDYLALGPHAKLLDYVLRQHGGISFCGRADWRPARLTVRSGLSVEEIRTAGAELVERGFAVIDEGTEEILMRKHILWDELLRNPKMAVAVVRAYGDVASPAAKAAVVTAVRDVHAVSPEFSSWTSPVSNSGEQLAWLMSRTALEDTAVADPITNGITNQITNPVGDQERSDSGSSDLINTNGISNRIGNDIADPIRSTSPGTKHLTPGTTSGGVTGVPHYARESDSIPPTPNPAPRKKFHDEHAGQWVDNCTDCEALAEEYMALVAAAAELQRPPGTCSLHPDGTPENCHPCGEARRARKQWEAERARWQAEQKAVARQAAADVRAAEIANCTMCDAEGYRGTTVCDHVARTQRRSLREIYSEHKAEGAEPDSDPAQGDSAPDAPSLRSVS
ncbi:hypothetical protein [Nocardia sp. NPDC058480]|uniref:hypothetical protein n=1 Tax=Nocardia sp. NPDC058480 TaxID=3346522 RepID=UPI00365F249C